MAFDFLTGKEMPLTDESRRSFLLFTMERLGVVGHAEAVGGVISWDTLG